MPSCSTEVLEGMVVNTDNTRVQNARKTCLDLLLSDHVGDCLTANPLGLDPAGGESDDDHRQHHGCLWNVASARHAEGHECSERGENDGELDGGVPGASADFHVFDHAVSSSTVRVIRNLARELSRDRDKRCGIARGAMTDP